MLNFLTANKITNMARLDGKLQAMAEKQFAIREELKPIERRLKTLDEHITYADTYMQFRINRQYRQQKPKQHADFYEAHRREMTLFEAADRYLKGVMNSKTALPTKAWKAERDKLTADKKRLNGEYVSLKNDTAEVEKIRKNVYDIMREEARTAQRTKAQDMEL
jgi:hypothetical protein